MHKLIGYALFWVTLVLMRVFDVRLTMRETLGLVLGFSVLFVVLYYIKSKAKEVK